jgi:hypothetical protein
MMCRDEREYASRDAGGQTGDDKPATTDLDLPASLDEHGHAKRVDELDRAEIDHDGPVTHLARLVEVSAKLLSRRLVELATDIEDANAVHV